MSLRFTLKIMRKLVSAGLSNRTGAHSGYRLANRRATFTLRQVIEAVEGPYRFSRCVDDDYICDCSPPDVSRFAPRLTVTRLVIKKLDEYNFDMLASKNC